MDVFNHWTQEGVVGWVLPYLVLTVNNAYVVICAKITTFCTGVGRRPNDRNVSSEDKVFSPSRTVTSI